MYSCQLCMYLIGTSCSAFDIIKGIKPLEHFSHKFVENKIFGEAAASDADVIFVNLQNMDDCEAVKSFIKNKSEKTQLILFADKSMTDALSGNLSAVTDIWTLPMSDEEIEFRFSRWQKNYKMSTDFWQTNHYLEATINSVPNLIWYKDKEGIHRKVNDSFCRTVNKTKEQVEGRDHYYIWDVDPDDPENEGNDCMESDREVMEKKEICVSEETVNTGDGMKLLTTYKAPLYNLDGSVMGTVGVGIDITQERAYEEEIVKKNHTLEAIFTTLECGVINHTLDGKRVTSINQAALNILGYETLDELVSDGFEMIAQTVMDEDKPSLRESMNRLNKTGDSVNVEYRVQHKNGEILHVMGNIKLLEENGEMYYQRFLLDVTARKLQEKENERQQRELVKALSIDFNLVFSFELDTGVGIPLRVDEESKRLFDSAFTGNILLKESMECYIENFVHEDDREMLLQACSIENLKTELGKKKTFFVNYRALIDGEIKYHEIKAVRTGQGDDNRIVLGIRNVDEETRNELEQRMLLENALAQANMANKAKSSFLSNMSHDIRTPMNAIVGFTSLALTHIDNKERVQEYLEKITSSGNHLLGLINDILDMSRIESGKMQIEEVSCNMIDIVQELSNIVQADVNEKQLNFIIDTETVTDEEIYCDKLRLNQVLLNIISNAIKYTKRGGTISFCVKEKTGASAGYADYQFCVEDTGIGISKEYITRIFEPFEREKNTTISKIQGTGLGMAITKNIVDMMNGSIVVESEQGVGTKVTTSLTFRLNDKVKKSQQASEPGNNSGSGTNADEKNKAEALSESERFRGIRILLAEDNELNQEIAAAILEDAGFEVDVAENGQVAVDMISASEPGYYRLVLMDVQMPVKNGYEATKEIRKLDNKMLATIPILAMTANAFQEDKENALKSGMNGHIAKPIDVKKLFEALTNVLF